jgi:hypothetical protein
MVKPSVQSAVTSPGIILNADHSIESDAAAAPPAPLQVEIVNASEVVPSAKIAKVKQGDDGKISGLVVDSVIE